jgi:hypothetical protein
VPSHGASGIDHGGASALTKRELTFDPGPRERHPGSNNERLPRETQERVTRAHDELQRRRGPLVARMVVELYENTAAPRVQFPTEAAGETGLNDLVRRGC